MFFEVNFQFCGKLIEFVRIAVPISLPDGTAVVEQRTDEHVFSVEIRVAEHVYAHHVGYLLRCGMYQFGKIDISGVSATMVIGVSWK